MTETVILTARLKEERDYWASKLTSDLEPSGIPLDFKRSKIYSKKPAVVNANLNGETYRKICDLTRGSSFLLYTILMAALKVCLHKYTRSERITVGSPSFKNGAADVGADSFLPIIDPVDSRLSFKQFLLDVRKSLSEAYERQSYPLANLVKELGLEAADNKCALFDVMLALDGFHEASPDLKNDISISFSDQSDHLQAAITFNARLHLRETIERFTDHYLNLISSAINDLESPVKDLQVMSREEQSLMLGEWNRTQADAAPFSTIHEMFEAQAEKTPDAIAIEFEGNGQSYGLLNKRANQLAHYLRELGIGPDKLVGVFMERSPDALLAILATLKAGGAYVPLDPAYPQHRRAMMMEDARLSVVLTQERLSAELSAQEFKVIRVDSDWEMITRESEDNPDNQTTAKNLAYVLYTSGSTGRPKGVGMPHLPLVNLISWQMGVSTLPEEAKTLQFASLSFDVSFQEIFSTWCSGGTLVLVSEQLRRDASSLWRFIADERIARILLPFVALQQLAEASEERQKVSASLREIITAGEQLQITTSVARLMRDLDGCLLINQYGPTEAHVVTSFTLEGAPSRWPALPSIGRPVSNAKIFLLDAHGYPVPIGVPGELYIGGVPLSCGYINSAELTAQKFIPDAFSGEQGKRLYRTGDLACYLPDGNIQYLGRIDQQTKIRGFRVELGEIETSLSQHATVKEAVVVAREDTPGSKRLVAYVVANQDQQAASANLRAFLTDKLPDYMIPSAFVILDALPLTPSGKVDRRALPAPDHARPVIDTAFQQPRTHVEEILAGIWAQVLGIDCAGVFDNFFGLGGDSILAIQVVARANRAGLRLTPKHLFQHQTIAGLATVVDSSPVVNAEQGIVSGDVPLTPIQHWFFEQDSIEPHHFNMAYLFEMRRRLSPSVLRGAIDSIIAHHDALRLRFAKSETGWRQFNAACDDPAPFISIDLSMLREGSRRKAIEAAAKHMQSSLDLSQGPVLRVASFEMGDSEFSRLLIVIHHLAVDGVSWRVLLEDLQTACEQIDRGDKVSLPQKTTSFKNWAERLLEYSESESIKEELNYWLDSGHKNISRLPVDHAAGSPSEESARTVAVSLDVEETESLLRELSQAGDFRINDVLLAALARAFRRWTGSSTLLVDLEGHGREEILEDTNLSRTVGWFTTITPVWLRVGENSKPIEDVIATKERLDSIPHRGIGYGLLRYLNRDAKARFSQQSQADVCFNYLGQSDQMFDDGSMFRLAGESIGSIASPRTQLPHLIYVHGIVFQNRLHMKFRYSGNRFERSTIESVAEAYLQELRSVIISCKKERREPSITSSYPLANLSQEELSQAIKHLEIDNVDDIYPLSPAQEGILFHSIYSDESGVYVVQTTCKLRAPNVDAVERAWQAAIDRHEILRTVFTWKDADKPLQVVAGRVRLQIEKLDWREIPTDFRAERIEEYLKADRARGFKLSSAPLMRIALMRLDEDNYQFIWSHHHLLLDGWSIFLVLKDVFATYDAICAAQDINQDKVSLFKDYIAWLQEQKFSEAESFWTDQLRGMTGPTPLPMDKEAGGSAIDEAVFGENRLQLPASITGELRQLARKNNLTVNTVVQGIWAILLSHYSGRNDVTFGATASGRPGDLDGVETMVGLFINVLPLRVELDTKLPALDWLKRLQRKQFEVRQYEYSPLVRVQRWSEIPRGLSLFNSILSFENYPIDDSIQQYSRSLEISDVRNISRTNYPITIIVSPHNELAVRVVYDSNRFEAADISHLLDHMRRIIARLVSQPDTELASIFELLTTLDRERIANKQKERERANFNRFKKVRPRTISFDQEEGRTEIGG